MIEFEQEISAYIICQDEAEWIEACVRSLHFCKEIVVVDSGSRDETVPILERLLSEGFPIRIFHKDWSGYASQKQFALEQCTCTWCLNIDADERVSPELAKTLPSHLRDPEINGWELEIRSYIRGYGYAPNGARNTSILRINRQGTAGYDQSKSVHESLDVIGKTRKITAGALLHRRAPTLLPYVAKITHYADLKAEQLFTSKRKPRFIRLLFNPTIYFIRLYFVNRLFLSGWAGFIHAGVGAIYSFLTEASLLQRHLESRELESEPDEIFSELRPLHSRLANNE